MGSETSGGDPDTATHGMVFWCLAEATKDEMIRWYAAALPGATREDLEDEGWVTFTLAPPGGSEGEDMGVLVEEDGKYRIFEHTKRKKPGL